MASDKRKEICESNEKAKKGIIIPPANAAPKPFAMMIHILDAIFASSAVYRSWWFKDFADFTID
jgi:hypothetical protein